MLKFWFETEESDTDSIRSWRGGREGEREREKEKREEKEMEKKGNEE